MVDKDKTKIKLRILLVHNFYKVPGGEDTVFYNEKKMLEKNENIVITYTRNNNEIENLGIISKLLLPFQTVFSIKTYKEISKIIKKEKIDIIHVHNTLPLISPSVYYAGTNNNVPVIQTMHNFRMICPKGVFYRDNHICEDCVSNGLKCSLKHKCYRNSITQTLIIVLMTKINRWLKIYSKINYICMTEFNKDKLLKIKQIKEKNIYIKPHFIENMKNNDNVRRGFLFASRISEEKNLLYLLKIWKEIDDKELKLIVCGDGPLKKECQKYCDDNELENVEFKGNINQKELFKIMSYSEALIFPTATYETFGLLILEANAVETPVIGPNIGNVDGLIVDGINGIKYEYESNKDLKEKILYMHKNGFTVSNDYVKKYNEDENYKILHDIYTSLIKKQDEFDSK